MWVKKCARSYHCLILPLNLREIMRNVYWMKSLCVCMCVMRQSPFQHFAFENILLIIEILEKRAILEKYRMFCCFAILSEAIFKNSYFRGVHSKEHLINEMK